VFLKYTFTKTNDNITPTGAEKIIISKE